MTTITKVKTSNTSRVGPNGTLEDDPHIVFTGVQSGFYIIEGGFCVSASTSSCYLNWGLLPSVNPTIPSKVSALIIRGVGSGETRVMNVSNPIATSELAFPITNGSACQLQIRGFIFVPSTCDLTLSWASHAVGFGPTTLHEGSWLSLSGPVV